jgi:hypothetical protein
MTEKHDPTPADEGTQRPSRIATLILTVAPFVALAGLLWLDTCRR